MNELSVEAESYVYRTSTRNAPAPVEGLDSHVYCVEGDLSGTKKLTKALSISGSAGDNYMVNAWGLGVSVPESSREGKTGRHFGVELIFVKTDNTEEAHYAEFSPDILDWQFLSEVFVAQAAYKSIKVSGKRTFAIRFATCS